MVWFMLALALCIVRKPHIVPIVFVFLHLIFRVIEVIGFVIKKRWVSRIGYLLATLTIIVLFFSAMVMGLDIMQFSYVG